MSRPIIKLDAVHVSTGPDEATIVTLYVERENGRVDAIEVIRDHGTSVCHYVESPALSRLIGSESDGGTAGRLPREAVQAALSAAIAIALACGYNRDEIARHVTSVFEIVEREMKT